MSKSDNKLVKFFTSKNVRYGTFSFVIIAVVIAITILINALIGMAGIKLDLTSSKMYSLSEESDKILKAVNKEVTIYGLFDDTKYGSGNGHTIAADLLKQYAKYKNIKVEYVDTDKNPGFIKSIDPSNLYKLQKDDFVIKCGKKIKVISGSGLFQENVDQNTQQTNGYLNYAEPDITGAIRYVTSDKNPTVYFLQGHGEGDLNTVYPTLKSLLANNNFDVKTLSLLTETKVPDDATIVIAANPLSDLASNEEGKIKSYLNDGGKAIFMFDANQNGTQLPIFERVMENYNIGMNYDIIKETDEQRHLPSLVYDIIPDVQQSGITGEASNVFMHNARSLKILKNTKEWLTVTSLITTSKSAVGERIDKTKGTDTSGRLDLAISSESKGSNESKMTRLLVIGDSNFVSDEALSQYGQYAINNLNFFMNAVNWMRGTQTDTVIQPKVFNNESMVVSSSSVTFMSILLLAVLPVLILGIGTVVWLRRRHL